MKIKINYQILTRDVLNGFSLSKKFPFISVVRVMGSCHYDENLIKSNLGSIWHQAKTSKGNTSSIERCIFWLSQNISHEIFHYFCREQKVDYNKIEEEMANTFGMWMESFEWIENINTLRGSVE